MNWSDNNSINIAASTPRQTESVTMSPILTDNTVLLDDSVVPYFEYEYHLQNKHTSTLLMNENVSM